MNSSPLAAASDERPTEASNEPRIGRIEYSLRMRHSPATVTGDATGYRTAHVGLTSFAWISQLADNTALQSSRKRVSIM